MEFLLKNYLSFNCCNFLVKYCMADHQNSSGRVVKRLREIFVKIKIAMDLKIDISSSQQT